MRLSVIVPSRLAPNPVSDRGSLWLDRALMQVRRQVLPEGVEVEIVLGLDKGMGDKVPGRFADIMIVESGGIGQAAAVNAAVRASTGDVLAFLEDDDYWEVDKLAVQLPYLTDFEFVSCAQREIDEMANFVGYNAFATPSGWMMKRELWGRVGPMNTTMRNNGYSAATTRWVPDYWFHVDTEWLGRLSRLFRTEGTALQLEREPAKYKRAHLVPKDMVHPWLANVRQHSEIVYLDRPEPLVQRYRNPKGGMGTIATDPQAKAQSDLEHRRLVAEYGSVPW